jgi:hypothetical protein
MGGRGVLRYAKPKKESLKRLGCCRSSGQSKRAGGQMRQCFARLCAIRFGSGSHGAVIRIYDATGNVIDC